MVGSSNESRLLRRQKVKCMGFVGRHMKNFTAKREKISGLFSPNSWWWPALALPIFGGIAIYFMIDGRTWDVWIVPLLIALWALYSLWADYRIWREKQKGRRQSGGQKE